MKQRLVLCAAALWLAVGCTNEETTKPKAEEPATKQEPAKEAPAAEPAKQPEPAEEADKAPVEQPKAAEPKATDPAGEAEAKAALTKEEKERLAKMPKGGLPAPDDDVVAWSEGHRVSSDSLRRYLLRLPPHLRTEYASVDKKMEMLRNLIKLEALVELAEKEGMKDDPDVVMAMKMEMAKKYLLKRFGDDSKIEVSDAEIEARYQKDVALYNKPEKVRASQIVLPDRATADKVLAEMRADLEKPDSNIKRVFREYVRKYSTDERTRRRGGDLLYFERDGKTDGDSQLDQAVVDAAFAATMTDQLTSVIEGRNGSFYILMVTSKREGISRPLAEVKEELRAAIAQEKLEAERKHFADTMVDFDAWTFDAGRVAGVVVDGAPSEGNLDARVNAVQGGKGAPAPDEKAPAVEPEKAPADKPAEDAAPAAAQPPAAAPAAPAAGAEGGTAK